MAKAPVEVRVVAQNRKARHNYFIVDKIEAGMMYVTEVDENGKEKKKHELPFKHSMMLPAFMRMRRSTTMSCAWNAIAGVKQFVTSAGT